MVPLLRAEGGEKEPQVGLVAPADGRPPEARERRLLRSWAKAGIDNEERRKLREAKATTLRRVLLAHSCAMVGGGRGGRGSECG